MTAYEARVRGTHQALSAPVKAYTQQGESPCQAERSLACNRRLLRRGNTGWRAAGGERPVRNNVKWKTQHKVNPIRPSQPASLLGTGEALDKTREGNLPWTFRERFGSLACSHEQKQKVSESKCRGWGGGVVGDRRVGSV